MSYINFVKNKNKIVKVKIDNINIESISTYLPSRIREMRNFYEKFGKDSVDNSLKGTGIERLHVADDHETSLDMCYSAAKFLIENEKINKGDIDAIVMVSQSFDYLGPASSIILQDMLGLSKDVLCFDIIYGCSGYIYGLYQAALLINSGSCKKVLLLNGETNTRLMDDSEKELFMVFGDAASATLLSKGTSNMNFHIMSDGSRHKSVINYYKGFRTDVLISQNNMPKKENGEYKIVDNDGTAVFDFIINDGSKSITELINFSNWKIDEIDFFGLHQATEVTLKFLRRRLKINEEKAPFKSGNYGNTSSVTIPLVLTTAANEESYNSKNWEKVILSAYGLGLSWGTVSCDLSNTKFYKPINI
jgi:3-oxoacyl-[acyl-carrier-protein] synthase-3